MLKNVGSNWTRNIVNTVTSLLIANYIARLMGGAENIWEVVNSWAGPLMLLSIGVPMASVRVFGKVIAEKDDDGLNRAISSCFVLYMLIALAALVIGGLVFLFFDASYIRDTVASDYASQIDETRQAYALTIVFISLNFFAQLPYGILSAHHDWVVMNVVAIVGLLTKLGLVMFLLPQRAELTTLASISVAIPLVEFVLASAVVKRRHPKVKLGIRGWDKSSLKAICGFSFYVLLLNMGIRLAFYMDGMVLGEYGQPGDPYPYGKANMLLVMLIEFIVAIGAVAMPVATRMQARGEWEDLRQLYLKWSKVAFSMALVAGLYLIFLGPEFLSAWLTAEHARVGGPLLQVIMVSGLFFMPVRGVSLGILMGLGQAGRPAAFFLAMGTLNLILSLVLVQSFGAMGVALGTAIPNVIFAFLIAGIVCKSLELNKMTFLHHVGTKAVLGAIPVCAALLAMKYWVLPQNLTGDEKHSFTLMILLGIVHTGVFGVVWVFFVYRGDPHFDLAARVRGLIQRIRR